MSVDGPPILSDDVCANRYHCQSGLHPFNPLPEFSP
jgi:hypothetical protein